MSTFYTHFLYFQFAFHSQRVMSYLFRMPFQNLSPPFSNFISAPRDYLVWTALTGSFSLQIPVGFNQWGDLVGDQERKGEWEVSSVSKPKVTMPMKMASLQDSPSEIYSNRFFLLLP